MTVWEQERETMEGQFLSLGRLGWRDPAAGGSGSTEVEAAPARRWRVSLGTGTGDVGPTAGSGGHS